MVKVRNQPEAIDMLNVTKARIKETGNITELVGFTNPYSDAQIVRLNADEYMVKSTGEVKKYIHSENRLQNLKNVRTTIKKLRDIINTNIRDPVRCKWLTLTYAENMTDNKRLYKDFESFWKRFLRYCSRHNIEAPEYISVVEPQARGAWHIHLILIWHFCEAPFIPNDDIARLWGNGFTKTKKLNAVDNLGAYFSAYLADLPLDELESMNDVVSELIKASCEVMDKDFSDEQGNIKSKKFVKGARLYLYPPGMNLYRTSRNLRKPREYDITTRQYHSIVNAYQNGKEKSQLGTLTFSSNSRIVAEDGKVINSINRYYFNTNTKLNADEVKNETCE